MKKFILIITVLALSLFAGQIKLLNKNAIDPVYQLSLKKYPAFLCEATLENGKTVQFVSVKSMLQVYYHQQYFIYNKFIDSNIKDMFVQDYITGKKINAKKALYVFGSKLIGPHGDDLIPLKDQASVKIFSIKFGGTRTMKFSKMSAGLIKYLDI